MRSECEICGTRLETHPPYCGKCWDGVIIPAYNHVESLKPDYPEAMTWHGYAVREAYIAGYKAAIEKGTQES